VIRIHFWGTRGSLPTPLDAAAVRAKVRTALLLARDRPKMSDAQIDAFIDEALPFAVGATFGGNTSCVQLDGGDPEYLLCDAGSGLRVFGNTVLARHGPRTPAVYNLLMSHTHWDHIMGFPFFAPAYIPGNTVRILGVHDNLREAFERQHGGPSFPIPFSALGAKIEFVRLERDRPQQLGGWTINAMLQPHGGDSYGYRIERDGKAIVYATDAEHKLARAEDQRPFVELFRNADVVIFDAMYSLGDTVSIREDWGHSSNITGVELAQAAGAKHLVLFHHEPAYDDALIARVLDETRRYHEIIGNGAPLEVPSAYDGLELVL
jgi:phosphoribosyl 1,2-cyclic phosphodiesterase